MQTEALIRLAYIRSLEKYLEIKATQNEQNYYLNSIEVYVGRRPDYNMQY